MDTQVNAIAAKTGMLLSKLRPAFPFMDNKTRQILITSKVKSAALYGSNLMVGQAQQVVQRLAAVIMRINRQMTDNPQGLRSTSALCKFLDIDEPKQEMIKHNFALFHKIIQNKQPDDILQKLILPKRRTGKIYIRGTKMSQRSQRSPIMAGINLFNAIPSDFCSLPHKMMKRKLKKLHINYSLFK